MNVLDSGCEGSEMDVLVTVAVIFHLDKDNSHLIVRVRVSHSTVGGVGGQDASFNTSLIIQFVGK